LGSARAHAAAMHAPCLQHQPRAVPARRGCARSRRAIGVACAAPPAASASGVPLPAARRGGLTPPGGGPAHFVHIDDLSAPQLHAVLARAQELKARFRAGDASFQPLRGLSMAMIFAKPSLRTRVSFETVRRARARPQRARRRGSCAAASARLICDRVAGDARALTRALPLAITGLQRAGRARHLPGP
jgi:hypothetical protein